MLVNIRGANVGDSFKGILLIAFKEGTQQIVGSWSAKNSSLKTISCNETKDTAITHSSANERSEIQAYWHAPSIVMKENIIIK